MGCAAARADVTFSPLAARSRFGFAAFALTCSPARARSISERLSGGGSFASASNSVIELREVPTRSSASFFSLFPMAAFIWMMRSDFPVALAVESVKRSASSVESQLLRLLLCWFEP